MKNKLKKIARFLLIGVMTYFTYTETGPWTAGAILGIFLALELALQSIGAQIALACNILEFNQELIRDMEAKSQESAPPKH